MLLLCLYLLFLSQFCWSSLTRVFETRSMVRMNPPGWFSLWWVGYYTRREGYRIIPFLQMAQNADKIRRRCCWKRVTSGKAGSEIVFHVKGIYERVGTAIWGREGKGRNQTWAEREAELWSGCRNCLGKPQGVLEARMIPQRHPQGAALNHTKSEIKHCNSMPLMFLAFNCCLNHLADFPV